MAIIPTARDVPKASLGALRAPAVRVSPQAFGAGIGEGLADVSKTISDALNKQRDEDNTTETKDLDNKLSDDFRVRTSGDGTEENPGYYSTRGKDALDQFESVIEANKKAIADLSGTASNDRVKRKFSAVAEARRQSEEDKMLRHVAKERINYANTTSAARQDKALQDAVTYYNDPALVGQSVAVTRNEASDAAQRNGLGREATTVLVDQAETKIHVAVLNRMVARGETTIAVDYFTKNEAGIRDAKVRADLRDDVFQLVGRDWVDGQVDPAKALEGIQGEKAIVRIPVKDKAGNITEQDISITAVLDEDGEERLLAYVNKKITAANRAKQVELRRSASTIADLEIAIDNGTADIDDIDTVEKAGLFEGRQQKRAELTKAWFTREEKKRKSEGDLTRVTSAINGELILDPKDTDDKKAVDGYWKQTTKLLDQQIQNLPTDQREAVQKTLGVNLVRRTGMIPKSMKGELVGMLRAGTPEQKVNAADMISRIDELGGNILADEMTKRDVALALSITDLVKAGVSPEQAVESAMASTDPANKPVIEAREKFIKDEKLADDYDGIVTGHFNPTSVLDFIPFGPSDDATLTTIDGTKSRVIADYEILFKDWFTKLDDTEKAQEQALKDLDRVWSVTRADGQVRVMKYAPEAFYSVGIDDGEWMKAQLHADINKIKPGIAPDSIMLGSDSRTAREAKTGKPTYPVLVKGDSGAFEELRSGDQIVRWRPDSQEAKRKSIKKSIDKARQKRQDAITSREFDKSIGEFKGVLPEFEDVRGAANARALGQ